MRVGIGKCRCRGWGDVAGCGTRGLRAGGGRGPLTSHMTVHEEDVGSCLLLGCRFSISARHSSNTFAAGG